MSQTINLKDKLISTLPPELLGFMEKAAALAQSQNERLYLVGGAVRDLLLGQKCDDIDLTLEGDATRLAKKLVNGESRVELHPQFGTAKIELKNGNFVDIARTRKETYARPGALPIISPGSISDDLSRRDFTVNAMAVALGAAHYGELIDDCGGLPDLEGRLLRVLHDKSFTDDATRIWRAVRYSERLGFAIETHTLELLRRDIDYLDTVSGDRIRYELECIMGEDYPEKAIAKAWELGVLQKLSPNLRGNDVLAMRSRRARELYAPDKPPFALLTALMTYPLTGEEIEGLISHLRLDKKTGRVLTDAYELRGKTESLGDPSHSPAQIYHLLHAGDPLAIQVIYIESNDSKIWGRIDFYNTALNKVKPLLSGKDLQKMGVPEGPEIKEVLELLLDAKLNGEIIDREDEEKMVSKWVKDKNRDNTT